MVGAKRFFQNLRVRPLSPGERAGSPREPIAETLQLLSKHELLAGGGAAQELLGGDPCQIDAGIRINQTERVIGPVRHERAVHRQRLSKPSILERQVAQELECLIAPGTTKSEFDDAPEQGGVAPALPFPEPALGQAVHAITVDRPRLGGSFASDRWQ